jgi:hypothetical protein
VRREANKKYFIDDRTDVLTAMLGLVPNLFLFGPQRAAVPATLRHVQGWAEVAAVLL